MLVRADGTALDGKTAMLRYLAAWIGPALALLAYLALQRAGLGAYALCLLGVNFLWAFLDSDRQFLHDRIAGSRVTSDGS